MQQSLVQEPNRHKQPVTSSYSSSCNSNIGRELILNGSYKLWEWSTHDAIQLIDTVES